MPIPEYTITQHAIDRYQKRIQQGASDDEVRQIITDCLPSPEVLEKIGGVGSNGLRSFRCTGTNGISFRAVIGPNDRGGNLAVVTIKRDHRHAYGDVAKAECGKDMNGAKQNAISTYNRRAKANSRKRCKDHA